MHFNLSEEQAMLQASSARFIAQQYPFEVRQQDVARANGFNPATWATFAELGWLSVPISEAGGGFGGSAADTMVLMEELGKGLVAAPYLATVMLFGRLIDLGAPESLKKSYLEPLIAGQLQGAFAYQERQSRYSLSDVKTTASRKGENYVLSGEKTLVMNGAGADQLIVVARTSGGQFDTSGISLFVIDANAAGVYTNSYRLMDGQLVANILLDNLTVAASQLLGEEGKGYELIEKVVNSAVLALSAEALGIMNKLSEATQEYTKARKQFGAPISSFQVLQHRMVDMFMACEQTRSLLYRAVCSVETSDADRSLHALKLMIGRNGRMIGSEAIQLHGGMGVTDELDVGHYVKRLMVINTLFGDADHHQQRLAQISLTK
ncbi:acyl-CoA dehydrogenase family protein [Marinobacter litoralis]|uniref:acyl-CoA dehydrogenase family protein n=1 Tax=Marinobacter litoralis TaxID=187981 RepID=UPI0018EA5A7D|nr:acyl-CoA dehydrogenase family protein [Marinobacter litoralis]MBJ6136062.1 acyl-CoA dehydrogenase family protein [Marinobacter litoralis]